VSNWDKLHDGKTYKIYDDWDGLLDLIWRYTVAAPDGEPIAARSTVWGARRAVRRHQRKVRKHGPDRKWWDKPLVGEVPRG